MSCLDLSCMVWTIQ